MYHGREIFFLEISLFNGTTDTAVLNLERCFTQIENFKAMVALLACSVVYIR